MNRTKRVRVLLNGETDSEHTAPIELPKMHRYCVTLEIDGDAKISFVADEITAPDSHTAAKQACYLVAELLRPGHFIGHTQVEPLDLPAAREVSGS